MRLSIAGILKRFGLAELVPPIYEMASNDQNMRAPRHATILIVLFLFTGMGLANSAESQWQHLLPEFVRAPAFVEFE